MGGGDRHMIHKNKSYFSVFIDTGTRRTGTLAMYVHQL